MSAENGSGGFAATKAPGHTAKETAAATASMRAEDPRWRWNSPVTRTTRDFVTRQFPVLQASYVVAVALICFAATNEGKVGSGLMTAWLVESAASFAVQWLVCVHVARVSRGDFAKSAVLRLLPLLAIVLVALHWSWTATIFIGATFDTTTVVVLLSFVMLSVAVVGIAPAFPAICVVYLVPMGLVTTYLLLRIDGAGPTTVPVLLAASAAVLWSAFAVFSGVRRYLVRGDEVDLLVEELQDRNSEVEALRRVTARDLEMRSAFFASASHDFRQRVHAMKLLAHSGLAAEAPRRERSSLARLAATVEDLESYMNDVLEFARLESTSLVPRRAVVRLQRIFQQIEIQFEDIALAKKVDLRVRATSLSLRSDAAMVVRIVENLVSNAIKFTRGRVLLAARRRDAEVFIEVWDQGPGIPADRVDKVFDAFYQGRTTQDGVGLGLAIVKRLAGALGYRVQVLSSPGRTRMRLVIPAEDVAQTETQVDEPG